jgi:hypothetical protein
MAQKVTSVPVLYKPRESGIELYVFRLTAMELIWRRAFLWFRCS